MRHDRACCPPHDPAKAAVALSFRRHPVRGRAVGDHHPARRHFGAARLCRRQSGTRSEEHTSELQSLMRISYAVFCLKKKTTNTKTTYLTPTTKQTVYRSV